MTQEQRDSRATIRLGFIGTLRVLWPYFRTKLLEQVKGIWFIVAYLFLFQAFILGLPIVYSTMISAGVAIVVLGLMFFLEGLRLGLMPFGETIGAILPRNCRMSVILSFAFLLGIGATFAEPAIAVLKAAGAGVSPSQAPLLYSLLNDFATQLVLVVGIGVGIAVALGVLRFFYGWSLKVFIIPCVLILTAMTLFAQSNEVLAQIIALAWDCGAVTTGPVTVPLVLALGIGVCRIVSDDDTSNAGFGIVTLASLFPIMAVLILGMVHYGKGDYFGAPNYRGAPPALVDLPTEAPPAPAIGGESQSVGGEEHAGGFSRAEFELFQKTGELPDGRRIIIEGGAYVWDEGRILQQGASVIIEKTDDGIEVFGEVASWDPHSDLVAKLKESMIEAVRAIVPLCLFLFVTLRLVLREKMAQSDEMAIGIVFAVLGMALFGLGIKLGLTPLGGQVGGNIPATFASITPWGLEGSKGPLFSTGLGGKLVAVGFAFFLGYGATLAEPALNALGGTVEKITVGAFKKSLLMQSVAIGVGIGIAVGVLKIAYNLPLAWLLLPPYMVLLFLTMISSEEFVNFGWDSAGVTTGPITVPLVLAMGLGIGGKIPGVIDGFGVLALASVGPIITVLSVGLIVRRSGAKTAAASVEEEPNYA
jgi:hypothetical protein